MPTLHSIDQNFTKPWKLHQSGDRLGAKEPKAELTASLKRFPSVSSGSPVLPASAFRPLVFRIAGFPALHTCPSIFSGSALLFHHIIPPNHECSLGS